MGGDKPLPYNDNDNLEADSTPPKGPHFIQEDELTAEN